MMTHEEYVSQIRAIEQRMRESKIEEAESKNRVTEACNLEHRRLKMEMHTGIQNANMRCREQIAEVHDRFVEERNRLWERSRNLTHQWREEHGITPPSAAAGQHSGEQHEEA